jgi:hypothetical protein
MLLDKVVGQVVCSNSRRCLPLQKTLIQHADTLLIRPEQRGLPARLALRVQ